MNTQFQDERRLELRKALEAKALALLALREHGDLELKRKLMQKLPEADEGLIDEVIQFCQQQNWQSDKRFIEVYVHQAMEKGQGPYKIRQGLQDKTRYQELVAECLAMEDSDWADLASIVLEKKYGDSAKPKDAKEQARRMRFLQSRGFSQSQIWKVFKGG